MSYFQYFNALKEHFEIITFPMAKMAIILQDDERCRIRSRYHPNIDNSYHGIGVALHHNLVQLE